MDRSAASRFCAPLGKISVCSLIMGAGCLVANHYAKLHPQLCLFYPNSWYLSPMILGATLVYIGLDVAFSSAPRLRKSTAIAMRRPGAAEGIGRFLMEISNTIASFSHARFVWKKGLSANTISAYRRDLIKFENLRQKEKADPRKAATRDDLVDFLSSLFRAEAGEPHGRAAIFVTLRNFFRFRADPGPDFCRSLAES